MIRLPLWFPTGFVSPDNGPRWYLAALLALATGIALAAWQYPGGYDWVYTVATALASRKKNPEGHFWVAGGLLLSMVLLWPCVSVFRERLRPTATRTTRLAIGALRVSIVCFVLVGAEGLLLHDLVRQVRKGHELLALAGFLGGYLGVLVLLVQFALHKRVYAIPVLLVISPLLAVGGTQLWLYIEQRNLGWVGPDWRGLGIPFWLSFAFWQWLAIVFLFAGLGLLAFLGRRTRPT